MSKNIITHSIRIFSLILIFSLMLTLPAFAENSNIETSLNPNTPVILGTPDPNAIVTDATIPDPNAPLNRTASLLFSFEGTNVYYMVATNATNKTFKYSNLSKGYLKVSGKGKYSLDKTSAGFRAGGCFYEGSSQTFLTYPTQYVDFENDVWGSGYLSRESFETNITYYGFMTNLYQDGNISLSGSFYLYNSNGRD